MRITSVRADSAMSNVLSQSMAQTLARLRDRLWTWLQDRERRFLIALLFLFFVRGVVWISIMPPLLGPDAPSHFSMVYNFATHLDPFWSVQKHYDKRTHTVRLQSQVPVIQFQTMTRRVFIPGSFWGLNELEIRSLPVHMGTDDAYPFLSTNTHPFFYYWFCSLWLRLFWVNDPLTQIFISRILSVLLGMIAVVLVYTAARELIPAAPQWARLITVFYAFHPMFTFVSSVVNLDAYCFPIMAFYYYSLLRWLRQPASGRNQLLAMLAHVMLITTKLNMYVVFAITGLALVFLLLREGRRAVRHVLWYLVPAVALAAFYITYPGFRANLLDSGQQLESYATKAQVIPWSKIPYGLLLHQILWSNQDSFWGAFGWHNVQYPDAIYNILFPYTYLCLAITLLGVVLRRGKLDNGLSLLTLALGMIAFILIIFALNVVAYHKAGDIYGLGRQMSPVWFPLAVCGTYGISLLLGKRLGEAYGTGVCLLMIALNLNGLIMLVIPRYYL